MMSKERLGVVFRHPLKTQQRIYCVFSPFSFLISMSLIFLLFVSLEKASCQCSSKTIAGHRGGQAAMMRFARSDPWLAAVRAMVALHDHQRPRNQHDASNHVLYVTFYLTSIVTYSS